MMDNVWVHFLHFLWLLKDLYVFRCDLFYTLLNPGQTRHDAEFCNVL